MTRKSPIAVLTLVSFCCGAFQAVHADSPDPALTSLPAAEQNSVAALIKVGARVRIIPGRDGADENPGRNRPLIVVILGREWRGDDADLDHARELSTLRALYVLGKERVSDKALDKLRRSRPNVSIGRRSEAMFGVAGEAHPKGLRITTVLEGSAADRAGIREDDVLVEFAGKPVPSTDALRALMLPLKPRDVVGAKLLRADEARSVKVELGEWKD